VVDEVVANAASFNADAQAAQLNRETLLATINAQGEAFQEAMSAGHDSLFADTPLFVTSEQVRQMQMLISAVERVVKLPGWMPDVPSQQACLGVFYGYDFHFDALGGHLIEINTNAGGAFFNELMIASQRRVSLPGKRPVHAENALEEANQADVLPDEQILIEMFQNEWRLVRGDAPLKCIAIVDEQPKQQYFYPEFLLAQQMFERAGVTTYIVDPAEFQVRDDGLYLAVSGGGIEKIDLVYNRLTDFSLQAYPKLQQAYLGGHIVLTPSPAHYERYADKRNLVRLSDADGLRGLGADEADIATCQTGVPQTLQVKAADQAQWWQERKRWFFKPVTGYGGKGTYRGANITRRVFGEIIQSDYIAQRMVPPSTLMVWTQAGEAQQFKSDVRCYVYNGQVQLVAARLYQGQTTNFRTPGGGFALVRLVE